jgi:DNA-binding MarR family transcriptional regulator
MEYNKDMEVSPAQVCDELISLLQQIKLHMTHVASAYKLTPMQLFAMYLIEQNGSLAMGSMATAMHCDASNVTGVVDRLVARGLLSRDECARDRRTKLLRLTEKGEHLMHTIVDDLPVILGCTQLNSSECRMLYDLMHKLALRPAPHHIADDEDSLPKGGVVAFPSASAR